MAHITQRPTIAVEAVFVCDEEELRALDALAGYGDDAFIKVFYEKLGKHYMEPHEKGLRQFLKTIRETVPSILSRTNDARSAFTGDKQAVRPPTTPSPQKDE